MRYGKSWRLKFRKVLDKSGIEGEEGEREREKSVSRKARAGQVERRNSDGETHQNKAQKHLEKSASRSHGSQTVAADENKGSYTVVQCTRQSITMQSEEGCC